jgi:hypothetical protein
VYIIIPLSGAASRLKARKFVVQIIRKPFLLLDKHLSNSPNLPLARSTSWLLVRGFHLVLSHFLVIPRKMKLAACCVFFVDLLRKSFG